MTRSTGKRRLSGIDRSGPPPEATLSGHPLNPWTVPNAIDYLRRNLGPDYRVEAVDTPTHSAAVYLAGADIPMARGWYRQDDFPQNEVLYDKLGAKGYLHWLRALGVRFVVLAHGTTDYSSRREAKLVRSGRAGRGMRPRRC